MSNSTVLEPQWGTQGAPGPRVHLWKKDAGRGPSRIMTYRSACNRWVLPHIVTEKTEHITCEDCLRVIGGMTLDDE